MALDLRNKVICVDTGGVPALTLHKVYDGMLWDNYIRIIDDYNESRAYKSKRFQLLTEFRADKLKELI